MMAKQLIKEVILENFMSYRYARVPLGPGVNLVVGPNGSGKSSLLLAISVALGQSYTERGRRLSDLIRWGEDYARVTLVINNEPRNGKRPLPRFRSSEVYLTRYLRRDGTYWHEANGRPITKAELVRSLARVGLNPENMLIIMHQGLVEEFVFLNPQERLRVVEDAVGLGAFRRGVLAAMKELGEVIEAERRAKELLARAEETLKYWEEQYSKFVKYNELREKLRSLERELAWSLVSIREEQVREAELRLKSFREEISKLKRRLEELRDRSSNLLREADDLERLVASGQVGLVGSLKKTLLSYAESYAEYRVAEYMVKVLSDQEREAFKEYVKLRKKLEEELGEAESIGPRVRTERSPEEIREEIERVKIAVAALGEIPPGAAEAYERYVKEYEEIKARAEEAARNKARAMEELEYRKRLWRSKLEELVNEVNSRYAEFLTRLGGVGEVRLVNADDLENAGLLVTVGFRGAEPVELNPYTQSGGERTTAVMCFLLALQSRAKSPFRAVDEFEIHMDPRNREAILKLILDMAAQNPDAQYLIITPVPFRPLPRGVNLIVVQKVRGVSYARKTSGG